MTATIVGVQPAKVAVMVVVPAAMSVTIPVFASTVATDGSLLLYVTVKLSGSHKSGCVHSSSLITVITDGSEAAVQENGTREEKLPTAHSDTQIGNEEHAINTRIKRIARIYFRYDLFIHPVL